MDETCAVCGAKLAGEDQTCPACGAAVRALLASVATGAEAALLEARLNSAGLPFMRAAHKGGGVLALLRAEAAPGTDFFVPRACLREAQAALGIEETAGKTQPQSGQTPPTRRHRGTLVLGLLVTAGLLALLYGLDAGLELLRRLIGGLPL